MLSGAPVETERADAARNRALLLASARRLLDSGGVDALTMEAIAKDAGVGKGTVFRRFGSRSGLLASLLNETESEFQFAFMAGPPPLGPGADPVDRLVAFGRARIDLLTTQGELVSAAENASAARHAMPPRAAAHLHILILLRQAGVTGDLPVLAFSLGATLDAALLQYENRAEAITNARLADGWEDLVRRVARP